MEGMPRFNCHRFCYNKQFSHDDTGNSKHSEPPPSNPIAIGSLPEADTWLWLLTFLKSPWLDGAKSLDSLCYKWGGKSD